METELRVATSFRGLDDGEGVQVQPRENLYFRLGGAPRLEITRIQGHRTEVYGGPSIRIAKGVYMRTAAVRRHYVHGVDTYP